MPIQMLRSSATRKFKLIAGKVWSKATSYSTKAGGRLEGKVALITGGASGLGKATAREFINHGSKVIIADNNSELGSQVADELGDPAHFVKCDVAVEAQIEHAVETAIACHGKLDIMYNNAGITGPSFPPSIVDLDLNEFDQERSQDYNLGGA
ncbi:hypothetical protein Tsubulata_034827, partial [Turnera subulata]